MVKLFTLFFSIKKYKNRLHTLSEDDMYKPSDQSVRTILDFARAYDVVDLKNCKEKDIILN